MSAVDASTVPALHWLSLDGHQEVGRNVRCLMHAIVMTVIKKNQSVYLNQLQIYTLAEW